MCGVAGIFSYSSAGAVVDRSELLRMREHMTPRGPDGAGLWLADDQRVGLAHRRLAIIDPSEAGAQPMVDESGRYTIVFNGEIYNYRALRADLEKQGVRFRSTSDTEVLLYLFARKGGEMVHALRGMFAFAIWDAETQTLFLARDGFGIKPLYYADDGRTVRFASQVKALLAGGGVDTAPDPAGHVGFFLWGSVPEPHTLYKGVRCLPAGHRLWVDRGGRTRESEYFRVGDVLRRAEEGAKAVDPAAVGDRLAAALADTVAHHRVADVPVGVFLSAGLDSSMLTALSRGHESSLHTVTLGFGEYRGTEDDESIVAERMAGALGSHHETRWVDQADFDGDYERLLAAMDQPSIDGVNTYFVSKVAAESGLKVALSGIGGDELFGSYPSFKDVPAMARRLGFSRFMPGLGRGLRIVSAPLIKRFTSPKYAGLLEYGRTFGGAYLLRRGLFMPWELPQVLDADLVREGWRALQPLARLAETIDGIGSSRFRVSALEFSWYMRNQLLRDADWAGMAHSVEIRVPLVDRVLLENVAGLIRSAPALTKRDAARSLGAALPAEVLNRPKTGFSVPVGRWLNARMQGAERGLRGWARWVHRSAVSTV